MGMDLGSRESPNNSNVSNEDVHSESMSDCSVLPNYSDVEEDSSATPEGSCTELSDEEVAEVKDGPPCELCGQAPCDWQTYCEDICQVCDELKDSGVPNNQVRFQAYRECTRLRHGVLCKHDQRPLPFCVRKEIMDCWPDPNGAYVGFQAAIKHAAEDRD
jgi:hypothetical protein